MSFTRQGRQVRRIFHKAIGLHLKRAFYYSGLGKSFFVDSEGRVKLRKLEMYLTNGCNLKCRFCSHFNPYRKGIVSTESLMNAMETWSKKIVPKKLGLLGGEPLMHPDLIPLLRKARECWPESRLILTTNGLLLAKKASELFDVFLETNTQVLLSEHLTDDEGMAAFDEGKKILEQSGVDTVVIPSASRWKEYYFFDEAEKPIPYQSRPEAAWTMCGPNTCFNLTDNKIYRCSILANAAKGFEEGALGEPWQVTQTYKPLEPDATIDEIVSHLFLMKGPLQACSICPERIQFVDSRQISRPKNR